MVVKYKERRMKRYVLVVLAVLMCTGAAYAACSCPRCCPKGDLGQKTVGAVTGTAQSAVCETGNIAQASVSDTVSTPMTAIQAVKNTASTAVCGADAAIKALTGEDQ